jgi:hypothetical protein
MSHQKTCWKGYDGVDAPKWNLEVEPMNYSNGRSHPRVRDGRRSQPALKCCWKGNVLLLIHAKASRKKRC